MCGMRVTLEGCEWENYAQFSMSKTMKTYIRTYIYKCTKIIKIQMCVESTAWRFGEIVASTEQRVGVQLFVLHTNEHMCRWNKE